ASTCSRVGGPGVARPRIARRVALGEAHALGVLDAGSGVLTGLAAGVLAAGVLGAGVIRRGLRGRLTGGARLGRLLLGLLFGLTVDLRVHLILHPLVEHFVVGTGGVDDLVV